MNVIELRFSKEEWKSFDQYISKSSRKRFLTGFTRILATRLQIEGVKCWLNCVSNWFNKNNTWNGTFRCAKKDCSIIYLASLKNVNDFYVISVSFQGIADHEKIYDQTYRTRCSGLNRKKIANNLNKMGILNTQVTNTIDFFNPFNKGI